MLAGPAGQAGPDVTASRLVSLANKADEPAHAFVFDPAEQLDAYRGMDAAGEDPVAVYHSHPSSRAVLSPVDVRMAGLGPSLWLVAGTDGLRLWRVTDGVPVAERLVIG